jgi:L-fucose isomerase-like protein
MMTSFINPEPTRLGLVCLARLTFEADLAAQWYVKAQAMVRGLDGVQLVAIEKLVIEQSDAEAAMAELKAANVDALVILSGTFALGGLAQRLAQSFAHIPLLLWAWPEPQEQTGKLRLNSLVGAHVNASNLYKLGYRPLTLYAALDDPRAAQTIAQFARAAGIRRDLQTLRMAFIGGHAPGFEDLAVDKFALRRALGVEVIDVGLETIVARAKAIAAERVKASKPDMLKPFDDVGEVDELKGNLFAALILAMRDLAAEGNFGAMTLKCWGDLVAAYGIAGCGVVSVLSDMGLYTGCEGDIMGTLSMLIARRLTGAHPFLTDFVSVEAKANTGLLWHGGCAPVSLAREDQPRHLFSHFAAGKGLTTGFALKPGRVTILRLGESPSFEGGGNHFRMLVTMGQSLESDMDVRGTLTRVAFDGDGMAFLDEMLSNGWEHHVVMAYGEIVPELELLARVLRIPLTVIK